MTHIEALQKLIARNKSFVRKNGPSDYTRETDELINALLSYVKQSDAEIVRLQTVEQNRAIVYELFAIPDEFKTMDNEFLQRYIKYNVVSEMWLGSGGTPENYELNEQSIIHAYRNAQNYIRNELELFATVKDIFSNNPDFVKSFYPHFYSFIKYEYTTSQVTNELKRKVYYSYE